MAAITLSIKGATVIDITSMNDIFHRSLNGKLKVRTQEVLNSAPEVADTVSHWASMGLNRGGSNWFAAEVMTSGWSQDQFRLISRLCFYAPHMAVVSSRVKAL